MGPRLITASSSSSLHRGSCLSAGERADPTACPSLGSRGWCTAPPNFSSLSTKIPPRSHPHCVLRHCCRPEIHPTPDAPTLLLLPNPLIPSSKTKLPLAGQSIVVALMDSSWGTGSHHISPGLCHLREPSAAIALRFACQSPLL